MSRFVPEKYQTEGGFSVIGLPILLAVLCAAGVGLGWLASFTGQWFYLIVLFPLAIGFGLILVGVSVGHLTKMRSPALAVLLGLVSSGVALLSMHYFNYQHFLKERQQLLAAAPFLEKMPADAKDAEMDETVKFLKQARAVDSFPSYLNLEATQGVTISGRAGQGGFNIGYVGTWIYWGLELVAVAVMATVGLVIGAAAPFCSACNQWKEERQLGTLQAKNGNVAAYLINGEIERLKEHDPAPAGGDLILSAAVCPNCKSEAPITVKLEQELTKSAGDENEKEERVHLTYPGEALAEFEALFVTKPETEI